MLTQQDDETNNAGSNNTQYQLADREHVWQLEVTDFFKNLEFYKVPETEQS